MTIDDIDLVESSCIVNNIFDGRSIWLMCVMIHVDPHDWYNSENECLSTQAQMSHLCIYSTPKAKDNQKRRFGKTNQKWGGKT